MKQEISSQNQSQCIERLSKLVNKFSFPRLAGTEGEREAVKLTIETTDSRVLLDAYLIIRKAVLLLESDYKILCKNEE